MIFETQVSTLIFSSTAILVADMDTGEILFATRTCETLFGFYVMGELVGNHHTIDELVPANKRSAHVGHRKAYAKQPMIRPMGAGINLEGCRRDGSAFPVSIALIPGILDGRSCVAATILDLSAQRQMKP